MNNRQKIVVVRYRFIGDTLLTIPFLRELRRQNPEAEIHLLVGKDAADLVADCPYIDKAIVFEPRDLGFWGAVKRVKSEKYDRAYILKRSLSSALIIWLAGVPERIGFDTDKRGFFLTKRVPYRERETHEASCFLDFIRQPDVTEDDLHLETWISATDEDNVQKLLHHNTGPHVVLHASSTNPAKSWPIKHFQQLAEMLISQYQASIYFLGPEMDKAFYTPLIDGLPAPMRDSIFNLCGKTSLLESMAMLKRMDLVVANDSGMIHMAAAIQRPVISIFGPMDPKQWYPLTEQSTILTHPNLTCRPCRMKITCGNQFPCLVEITPQMVFDACKAYLKS